MIDTAYHHRARFAHLRAFGQWCREQRKARGWTQKQVAAIVGCHQSTVSNVESAYYDTVSIELEEKFRNAYWNP